MAIPRTAHVTALGVVIAVGLSCTVGATGAVAATTPAPSSSVVASTTSAVTDPSIPAPVVQMIRTDPIGTQWMLGNAGTDRVEVLDGDTVISAWPAGGGLFQIAVGEQYRDTELTIVAERIVDGEARRSVPVVLPRTLQVEGLTTSSTTFTPGAHEFRGTATAGATITATDADGTPLFEAEVPATKAASGSWSATVDLTDAKHTVTFTQTAPSGITTRMQGIEYVPAETGDVASPELEQVDRGVDGAYLLRGTASGAVVATVGADEYTGEVRDGSFTVRIPASHVGATAQVVASTDEGTSAPVSVELPAAEQDDDIAAPSVRDVFNLPGGQIMVTGDSHAPGAIWFLHGDRVVAGTLPDGGFSYSISSEFTDEQLDMVTMQSGKISERVRLPRLLSVDGVTAGENTFVPGAHEFSGRAEAGSTVVARDADGHELFKTEATGAKSGVGTWSASTDLPASDLEVTFTQTTPDGKTSTMRNIAFTAEDAAPVTPVAVTGPVEGSTVTTKRPVFTGTGAAGAAVVVRGSSREVAKTTVQEDGTWSVPADFDLGNGDYRLLAVQTPAGGGAATVADIVFTVRHAVAPVVPFAVTGPAEGSTVTSKRPVFTGTGAEGATIVVKGTSRQVASATVEGGTWSVPADFDLGDNTYRLTVVQTPAGGGASAEKTVTFTVRAR